MYYCMGIAGQAACAQPALHPQPPPHAWRQRLAQQLPCTPAHLQCGSQQLKSLQAAALERGVQRASQARQAGVQPPIPRSRLSVGRAAQRHHRALREQKRTEGGQVVEKSKL